MAASKSQAKKVDVRILVPRAGVSEGEPVSWATGDVVSIPAGRAERLVNAGEAEYAGQTPAQRRQTRG